MGRVARNHRQRRTQEALEAQARDAAVALQCGLKELGYVVAIAHDGPSALAKAATFKPEVGLLDIGLPVMDGYALAVALRAAHDIRLVAITGYGHERDRRRSRAAGIEAHLVNCHENVKR
jgi:CheY-like chemotaxis protein